MASDASIEMPEDEPSTSGGEAKTAANGLSNVVGDARILEVKERELILKHRIEVGEEEFAEARWQLERRRRDKEDEFDGARRQLERRRQDEENEFAEARRQLGRQRQDEDAEVQRKLERRQDEDAKLWKAARRKKRAFEMESIALQRSLLEVKKYDAEGAAKYDETPKVSDETFSAISERLTTNFLSIDTKFVSAEVDDKNVSSSRSLNNPSPVSPSATFPTALPVAR